MSEWPTVTLGEVCSKPQYGAIAAGSDQPLGPLLVRQTDLVAGRIDWSNVPYSDLGTSEYAKYALKTDDLLIARLGSVGRAARVRDPMGAVFAGYLVRFTAKHDLAFPAFLGYQLQSPDWREYVNAVRSGAVQPTLNATQMAAYSFSLSLPSPSSGRSPRCSARSTTRSKRTGRWLNCAMAPGERFLLVRMTSIPDPSRNSPRSSTDVRSQRTPRVPVEWWCGSPNSTRGQAHQRCTMT